MPGMGGMGGFEEYGGDSYGGGGFAPRRRGAPAPQKVEVPINCTLEEVRE